MKNSDVKPTDNLKFCMQLIHVAVDLENCADSNSNCVVD